MADKKDWSNAPGMVNGPATTGTVEQQKKFNAKREAAKAVAMKKMMPGKIGSGTRKGVPFSLKPATSKSGIPKSRTN
jgi:hypothetical protein